MHALHQHDKFSARQVTLYTHAAFGIIQSCATHGPADGHSMGSVSQYLSNLNKPERCSGCELWENVMQKKYKAL